MSLYNIGKLVQQTRQLCVEWHAQGKTTGLTGEIAAFDAASNLDLELCEDKSLGYNAIGKGVREGQKVLIKGRAIFKHQKSRQRLGQLNLDRDWDLLMLVLLDEQFEAYEIYEARRAEVEEATDNTDVNNRKGQMSVAKMKVIGRLVWEVEEGETEDEVWENTPSAGEN